MSDVEKDRQLEEVEKKIKLIDKVKEKWEETLRKGKEEVKEELNSVAGKAEKVKKEIDKKAEEELKKRVQRKEISRFRARGILGEEPVEILVALPGDVREEDTLAYQGEEISAIVSSFFSLLREDLESNNGEIGNLPYAPESLFGKKLLEELAKHGIDQFVNSTTAVYLYQILKNLYDGKEEISEIMNSDDFIRLYTVNNSLGEKVLEALKEAADKAGKDIKEYIREVEEKMERYGLGRYRTSSKFSKEEIEELAGYWRKVEKAKEIISFVISREVDDLYSQLTNEALTPEDRIKILKKIDALTEEQRSIQEGIEEALISNNIDRLANILERWAIKHREGLDRGEIKELIIPREWLRRFSALNARAIEDLEFFLQGISGIMGDPKVAGLTVEMIRPFSVANVRANFENWFEWNKEKERLEFKRLDLYVHSLKVLHNYLNRLGVSPSEEWQSAVDQQMLALLTRAVKIGLGKIISATSEELEPELRKIAEENGVSFRKVENEFRNLISNIRRLFDDELAAQAINHEGTRLILQAKAQSTEEFKKLMLRFDGDRAIGVFGALDKELIDISARLFAEQINFYAAQHDNRIKPDFFRAFFDDKTLVDFPDMATLRRMYIEVIQNLLDTSEELRRALGISKVDELESWRLDRAFRLGLGRAMIFEARVPALMGIAEPWEGYEDQLPILAFFGFRHHWNWGRGKESLEPRLRWVFDLIFEEDPEGFKSLFKPWVPSEIYREIEEGKITTLAELEKAVSALGSDAKRLFKEGKKFVIRDILREFSFGDLFSRGGWRMKILEVMYENEFNEKLKKNYPRAYERIIKRWGAALLFNLTKDRTDKDIEDYVLKRALGEDYKSEYLEEAIKGKKKKIFEEREFTFLTHDGKRVTLTPKEFIEKKKLFYEGKLLFHILKRSPIDFLNVITRMVPELVELKEHRGRLIGAHELYFDDDFLNSLSNTGDDRKLKEKILKFRLELSKYWDKARFSDLREVARAWYELQKEGFKELLRKEGITDPQEVEVLWNREGKKRAEEVKNKLFTANFAAAQRMLYKQKEDVFDELKDEGFEGVIKKVIFGRDRRRGLVNYFESQNLDFADSGSDRDKIRLGRENLFSNLADVWLNYKAKGVIPTTGESRFDEFYRNSTVVGNLLFARNWGDNHAVMGTFTEVLGKIPSALKEIGTQGTTKTLEEGMGKISGLKGILGGDKVTRLNQFLIYTSLRYVQEDWRARLPEPIGSIFRLLLGKKVSLNRLIEAHSTVSFNDENNKYTIRRFVKRGFIKDKHRKLLEKILGVANEVYIPKFAASIVLTLGIILVIAMIKKAFEEESKEE